MKHNYLNNRDILKEIHKSKTTYCSYLTPEDGFYDMILPGVDKINKKNIAEGVWRESMGVVEIPRNDYLDRLADAIDRPEIDWREGSRWLGWGAPR